MAPGSRDRAAQKAESGSNAMNVKSTNNEKNNVSRKPLPKVRILKNQQLKKKGHGLTADSCTTFTAV
jgi:hypothetical protein